MGDSEDEFSANIKRNRDKFYRERDDVSNNYMKAEKRDWNNEKRDSWKPKSNTQNYSYAGHSQTPSSNSRVDFQRRYNTSSFDSSPPLKRKKDWENGDNQNFSNSAYEGNSSYQSNYGQAYHDSIGSSAITNIQNRELDYPTQPAYMSFKQFLQQQDDGISEEDAIKKYNSYKIEFKKAQINEFFLSHKEEEWFKSKYHPDEYYKRYDEQKKSILSRLEVFMNLYKNGWLDNVLVEVDKSNELIKFLDAAIILMEGGDNFDLKVLNNTEELLESEKNGQNYEARDKPAAVNNENNKDEKDTKNQSLPSNINNESGSESGAYSESDDDTNNKVKSRPRHRENVSLSNETKRDENKIPQSLHRTTSIFLRNLPSSVTKEELEILFKTYSGFKRVAISDPAPERGFFRRGWITFDSNVNIKDLCWSLNNLKIRDCNPGAIVNRDLNRRVRPTSNYICHHKPCVKNDIKIATQIIENLDKKWNLWTGNSSKDKSEDHTNASNSTSNEIHEDENINENSNSKSKSSNLDKKMNPLLENIADYLVDEISAEEEELMGLSNPIIIEDPIANKTSDNIDAESNTKKETNDIQIDTDNHYNKVLDKLILYLRVVHSFDYYNCIEYQQEDSMPNRCGIIHARASLPTDAKNIHFKIDEINSYISQFDSKMKPYIEYKEKLDQDTAKKLGLKDKNEEVEKFIKTNTQELAPDRWLCPLSGKKFKGPEFIRKHLFYKHEDKLNEVKKEVEYFNNYLLDPKRPQLPEHPLNRPQYSTTNGSNLQQHQQNSMSSINPSKSNNINMSNAANNINSPLLPPYILPPLHYGNNIRAQQNWQQNISQMNIGNGPRANFSPINMNYQYGGFGRNFNTNTNNMSIGNNYGGSNRRPFVKDQREIIHYKDLDAPEDA